MDLRERLWEAASACAMLALILATLDDDEQAGQMTRAAARLAILTTGVTPETESAMSERLAESDRWISHVREGLV